jgi:hypothetical protein
MVWAGKDTSLFYTTSKWQVGDRVSRCRRLRTLAGLFVLEQLHFQETDSI